MKHIDNKFTVPTVIYTPIDGINLPNLWYTPARLADTVVAMSKFGQDVIKQEADIDSEMVWHGIEHEMFWKVSEDRPLKFKDKIFYSKKEVKSFFKLDKNFVVLAINRNSIRKNYYDTFKIFNEFRKLHDDARLLIHCVKQDEGGNLDFLVERYNLQDHVIFSDPKDTIYGVNKNILALYYNLADVKISTSTGEGFGLTDAEALACGCPVLAQDFSATTEVVGNGGILIKPQRHFTTARMIDLMLPDIYKYVDALEELYENDSTRNYLSNLGVEHAQQFNWDSAAWQFEKIFKKTIKNHEKKMKNTKIIKA